MNEATKTTSSIPIFTTEPEELAFWADHDVVDFFDWDASVEGSFPLLKPSTSTISVRLPAAMLEDLKSLASEQDVPYQSLLKIFLAERIAHERQRRRKNTGPDAKQAAGPGS